MRKSRLAGLVVLAIAGAVAVVGAAAAHPGPPSASVIGHVYVNDNTAPNTVAGFNRLSDGTLEPIPGSPFAAGGAGTGHANASQGSLELTADGRYLLAVDAGSNEVSVLRIKPDGSLQLAEGSPVSSNGVNPVSIAVFGGLVYVANQGPGANPGDSNYTGFTLNAGGQLRALQGSTVAVDNGSLPADVLFNGDGTKLVGARVGSSQIDSFTVGADGLLTAAPGSPFSAQGFTPPQGWGQLGSEFSPTNPNQLFVSDAHNAAGGGAPGLVSSFTDAANGVLSPIGPSPVADGGGGIAACWVEISHDGVFMFVVNTGSATVSTYSIASNGSLAFVGTTPTGELGRGAEDARLSPDGSTLWVVQGGADAVTGFSVDGGTLTPLTSAAGPAGAAPSGIVVN